MLASLALLLVFGLLTEYGGEGEQAAEPETNEPLPTSPSIEATAYDLVVLLLASFSAGCCCIAKALFRVVLRQEEEQDQWEQDLQAQRAQLRQVVEG